MPSTIVATGLGGLKFENLLRDSIRDAAPDALGIAVAYVSVPGFKYVSQIARTRRVKHMRLVTDIKDGITHPKALAMAMRDGWEVRVVSSPRSTFHPKLYVGGRAFHDVEGLIDASLILLGSANLSSAALKRNGECSYRSLKPTLGASAGLAWQQCWMAGTPLTDKILADYGIYFSHRNQFRQPEDLSTLGVRDSTTPILDGVPAKDTRPPPDSERALPNDAATTAWAGLQSFTGDYNLQVEFPKDAGNILLRILGKRAKGNVVTLKCEDGTDRVFIFKFYTKNGMFRLNVPNDTPSAEWVRKHKQGIAIVELLAHGELRFRIVRPGPKLDGVVYRSISLGTWGRTTKRLYGWY